MKYSMIHVAYIKIIHILTGGSSHARCTHPSPCLAEQALPQWTAGQPFDQAWFGSFNGLKPF